MCRFRQRKAFTIVEMVIVIAVIAILATVLVPTISGVIQQANLSTDKQFAASLNVQLALWQVENNRTIQSESDLRDAINHYYGEKDEVTGELTKDFYAELTTKSVKQGNYYWYAYDHGVVFVANPDNVESEFAKIIGASVEAPANRPEEMPVVQFLSNRNDDNEINSVVALSSRGKGGFGDDINTSASFRFNLFAGTYLMGGKGHDGDILDSITKLENMADPQDYEDLVNELKVAEEDTIEKALFEKVKTTTIFTEYGVFTYQGEQKNIYKVQAVSINVVNVYMYYPEKVKGETEGIVDPAERDSIEPPIKIADEGAKIDVSGSSLGNNALADLFNGKVEVHVDVEHVDELKDVFGMNATGTNTIVLPNGEEYHFSTENAFDILDSAGNVAVTVPLKAENLNVEITYDNGEAEPEKNDVYFYNGTLYLAWDFDEAKLSLKENLPNSIVDWTVSDGALIAVNPKGEISLVDGAKADAGNDSATITATLKNSDPDAEPKTHSINVKLVFPNNLSWKLGETVYSAPILNAAINLEYTGAAEFALSQLGIGYTQAGYVKMNADDLAINFSTSGALFSIADGKLTINPDAIATNPTQTLTVTYGNAGTTYITQEYTVTVVDNSATPFEKNPIIDNECNDSTCTDKDNCTHNDLLMGDTYLFRVGNANTIKLSTLFNVDEAPRKIKLTIYDASKFNTDTKTYDEINKTKNDLDATYTSSLTPDNWASSTIKFTKTGVAIIRIENEATKEYKELAVEVVDGYNVTSYSELSGSRNSVLLSDIKMTSNGNFDLSANKYIYGNGFTFDITEGATAASTRFGIITLGSGSLLDNIVVVGATFPDNFGNSYNSSAYYVAAVYLNGGGTISNSYISGCRTPVRSAGGTIINTTLHGGKYGNLYADAGTTTIEDLTTINQPGSIDGTVGGMGIVLDNSAVLKINGKLTQHNWINSTEKSFAGSNEYTDILFGIMFGKDVTDIQFTHGGNTWVNTGIFQLKDTTKIDGNAAGYGKVSASYSIAFVGDFTGYAYTCSYSAGYVFNGRVTPEPYVPTTQGAHAPTVTWSNDAYKDGKHDIKFDEGQTSTFNPNVLTATHYGNSLAVNVTMDGVNYTGKDIVFNDTETTTHTIVYSYYAEPCYDKDGNKTNEKVLFEQKLEVKVTVAKNSPPPTFTFYYGTNGSASAGSPHVTQPTNSYAGTVVQDGSTYYIMPNASATSANAIGSKTINGKTIYYPIVDGINVRSGNSTDYDFDRHYPIFKAVSISDNGKSYSYSGTTAMPDTVTWVSAEFDSGNGVSGVGGGITLYNNKYLCQHQSKAGNAESGGTTVVKFSYAAEDGNTYNYYVGYRFYDESESSTCFTPDTLITLADGTQKRVDELKPTDTIIAWDFFTGTYVEKKISLLVNHGEALYKVTNLKFSDGTELKLIGDHGVFDYDLNKYVYFTPENYTEYIGHTFVKQNLNGGYDLVQLVDGSVTEEYTSAWSVSSAETSNAFASGMLTVAPPEDFYNWIEMSGKLQYNVEQFAADVAQYGLYTYEDFADYVTYEQFVEWNGAYLKIAVEKGYFTFEYILELIEMYKGWMP